MITISQKARAKRITRTVLPLLETFRIILFTFFFNQKKNISNSYIIIMKMIKITSIWSILLKEQHNSDERVLLEKIKIHRNSTSQEIHNFCVEISDLVEKKITHITMANKDPDNLEAKF